MYQRPRDPKSNPMEVCHVLPSNNLFIRRKPEEKE